MLKAILNNLIFPEFCISCYKPGLKLCRKCESNLIKLDFQLCIICENLSISGKTHLFCQEKYSIDRYLTPYIYKGIVREIIIRAKFYNYSYKILSALIDSSYNLQLLSIIPRFELITFAPAGINRPKRLINHSEYIATQLSTYFNVPSESLFFKQKSTKAQKLLSKAERIQNIKSNVSFNHLKKALIKGKIVLLVDDVSTTGATLLELGQQLKLHGASKVYAYTLAKDILYN